MILAAGRGERMRPLSDHTPKPLLMVQGKRLIEWHIERFAAAGVREIAINCAWLEAQFEPALGDGSRWGVRLQYFFEQRDHGGALETAGGLRKALPWLAPQGHEAFWVASGDVFLPGFACDTAAAQRFAADATREAHLWLIPNPAHRPQGDFAIGPEGRASASGSPTYTWSCIGLFKPSLLAGLPLGQASPLRPWLDAALARHSLSAELYCGAWSDVGTPERLAQAQALR
ncbi:NDP-sugar synthase [Roseateles sp. BYS180W]|uniref:NDP-sugar synthase n=2 Tax=Roseateles rivi TaxID=3299028 RepID=A0ABW7FT61_9BURK